MKLQREREEKEEEEAGTRGKEAALCSFFVIVLL
jgi:hypothetical protein